MTIFRSIGVGLALLACAGCMSLQAYEGPGRPRDEVARVSGDMRISAGAPISVLLRQVDGHTLGIGDNSVDLLPGSHTFLVDCVMRETSKTSRYSITADVEAGGSYHLRAQTAPGMRECSAVSLEASD